MPPLYALLTPSPPPPHVAHSPTAPPPWPSTTLHPTQPQTVAWTGVQPQPREEKEDGAARRQVASMPPLATGFDTSQQQQQLLYLQQLWAQHNFLQQQLQQQQQQPYHPQQQLQHPQSFQPHSHRLSGRRPASSPFGTSSPRRSADPASSPRGSGPSQRSGHSSQVAAPSSTKQAAAAAFAVSVSQASSRTSKRSSLPAPLHAAAPADPRTNTGHYSRPDTSPHAAPIAVAPTAATNPQHQQQQHQYPRTAVIQSPQHRSSSYPYPPSLLQSSSDEETYSNSDAIYTRNGQAASHFPMPPSSRQRPSDDDEEDSETEHDRHCETGSLDLSSDSGDDAAAAAQSPSEGSGSASPLAGTWSRDDESFVEGLAASFGRGPSASIVQPAAMRTMSSMSSSRPVAAVVPAVINSRPGSSSNHNHNRSRSHSRRASDLQHRVAALLAQHQPQQQQQSPKHRPKSTSGDRPQGGSNFKPRIGSAPRDRLMLQQQQQRRPQSSGMLSPRASNAAAQEAAAIFASSAPAADAFPAPQTHVAAANVPLLPPARSLFLSTHSPFFRRLPDELWSEIMGGIDAACLLCVVARLNREASRAVRDPEWWRQVRLGDGFAARLLAQQVSSKNAATSGGSMDRLHPELSPLRSGPSASLPSRLLSLSARWTLLESLDLSGVGAALTDDFFLALTKNHGSTANRGSSNSGGSGEVGAARFWSRSLRSLSLARCTQVTDVTLAALAPCCLALQTLDLSALALVTDEGFAAFLARIDAAGAGPNRNAGRRHGGGSGCQLVQLKLNRCYGLGDAAMGALATHAPRLQDLDLTFCNRVTDAGLAALASLAGSREGDASAAPAATPGLRQLSLRWCRSITDAGVRSLFSSPNGVIGVGRTAVEPPCNVLSYLNVDHCTLLTDESLECIAVHATALKQLSMVFCNKVSGNTQRHQCAAAFHSIHADVPSGARILPIVTLMLLCLCCDCSLCADS